MRMWPGYPAPASGLYGALGIVGESHYAVTLADIVNSADVDLAEARYETRAIVQRHPDNEFDRNAVVVLIAGRCVGYIPRDAAVLYQPALSELERRGVAPECNAVIAWRPEQQPIRMGVWVELAYPDELEAWLGLR